ncbi:MAG: hypothetical protein CSA62_08565 [Planctomycetota bacterium]|nr:MAG: hypothetical protein CSA62_08565 [Planctomycetota bacterium]
MSDSLELALVRPQSGENIGLVVRLCANYGLAAPLLVAPEPGWERAAARTASMCRELLAQTLLFESIEQACEEAQHVLGFTARAGKERRTMALESIHSGASAQRGGRTILVFGNERTGLEDEDCGHCTELYRAALPGLPSFNLSHAVATVLYELHRVSAAPAPKIEERTSTHEERQLLIERVRNTLSQMEYRTADPHFDGALRRLLRAQALQRRDLRILHKILTHLEYREHH